MTSFPHSLVLDSIHEVLNLYNFLMNWLIFMKIVAKCSALVSLSYKLHVKVCDPIPLTLRIAVFTIVIWPGKLMFLWSHGSHN